eukprot:GCRY01000937.1.p1 GENE.GCRY01000937.1~~GCRY01000937.1.p1  ORF type:complete len:268 (+),score=12.05 GCRY01000937.1:107-910(+)
MMARKKGSHPPLVPFNKVAPFLHDKAGFITKGYRRPLSFRGCVNSLSYWHNQSVNAWTALLCACIGLVALSYGVTLAHDWRPFFLFFCYATFGGLISASFHVFGCHSKTVYEFCRRFDHISIYSFTITLTMAMSWYAYPPGYFAWNTVLSLVTSIPSIIIGFLPFFDKWESKVGRALLAFFAVLNYTLPVFYRLISVHFHPVSLLLVVSLYLSGVIYAFRLPERFFPPGTFTIFHSHGLMHICVLVATICEALFIYKTEQLFYAYEE